MLRATLALVAAGLLARAAAQQCGELLRTPATFSSPAHPEPYSSNLNCEWEIIAERGIRISLHFLDLFSVESEVNCTKDAVIVYDWKEDNYVEIARLCGTDIPPAYESTFNKMKVVLKTDQETNLPGFRANWSATCGGNFIATEKQQVLYSPGYPNYWPNMTCDYTIQVIHKKTYKYDEDKDIGLYKFIHFELEDATESHECNNDYVRLPSSSDSDYYDEVNEKHCGIKSIPGNYFIEQLKLRFVSNGAIEKNGFEMAFSRYTCGGRITEPTTITAGHIGRYWNNQNCTWTIEAPQNKKVVVKFNYVNLRVMRWCGDYSEYIKLYDGLLADPEKKLAAVCGNTNSPLIIPASGNTMTFHFQSGIAQNGISADIFFAQQEINGCGGLINMTNEGKSSMLESPTLTSVSPGDMFDCVWHILAPPDHVIKFQLTSLSSECASQNILEIRDGIVPDSLLLGSYCGNSLPLAVSSSSNRLSIRISGDGTSKFAAIITTEMSLCKPTVIKVTQNLTRVLTPGYVNGSLARGINCAYEFQVERFTPIHLIINNLNVLPSTTPEVCDKDKIIIGQRSQQKTLVKNYTISNQELFYMRPIMRFQEREFWDKNINLTQQYEFCGSRDSIELYLSESFFLNMITTPENVSLADKGLEIQVTIPQACTRNYTEPFGRILFDYFESSGHNSCLTLITAPEGYTINLYFIALDSLVLFMVNHNNVYLEIYDGNTTKSDKLYTTTEYNSYSKDNMPPVFSTGRYLLLDSKQLEDRKLIFDLNYVVTNQGPGCGGYLFSDQGAVSSPFYPYGHAKDEVCEFELETPPRTRLALFFKDIAVSDCENNDLQVVDRNRQTVKTLCNEYHYNYTSTDNYVRIVSKTSSLSKYNTKWLAMFAAISAY